MIYGVRETEIDRNRDRDTEKLKRHYITRIKRIDDNDRHKEKRRKRKRE